MGMQDFWNGLTGKNNSAPATTNQENNSPTGEVTGEEENLPLSDAQKWFTPDPDKDAKPNVFDPSKLIDQSPESMKQLNDAIASMDFMKGVATPEALAKLEEGGQGAVQTTIAMMNKMAQEVLKSSILASTQLNTGTVSKVIPEVEGLINSRLKATEVEKAIKGSNPVLSHPASAFMVQQLKSGFQAKFPDASPEEITQMANKYIDDIVALARPKPKTEVDQTATDWAKFGEELSNL